MLQNWKSSNHHAYFSFFVCFHLYLIYRFGFSLPALLYWITFLFFSKQIGCYFVCDCACDTRRWSNNSNFYIFAIQSIPWSTIQTMEVELLVVGAKNRFMVLVTIVIDLDAQTTGIINHVQNYPLGCTIPYTHYILLFFLMKKLVVLRKKTIAAKSIKNLALNTLIVVTVVTSTFTSNALFCNLKLNSTITHTS